MISLVELDIKQKSDPTLVTAYAADVDAQPKKKQELERALQEAREKTENLQFDLIASQERIAEIGKDLKKTVKVRKRAKDDCEEA